MKFTQAQDIEDYKKALMVGALKGIPVGALFSVGATFVLKRRTTFFKNAGGYQKGLLWVAPSVFTGITFMESASRSFEDHERKKQHGIKEVGEPHKSVSSFDAFSDFFGRNKYKFVTAGWAASMAGSFYIVNRDPYMTKAQKVVQARVYAQGLTVAMLLLTVFMSVGPKKTETELEQEKKTVASHSWERDIGFVQSANHPVSASNSDADSTRRAAGLAEKKKEAKQADADKKTGTDQALQDSKQGGDAPAKSAPQDKAAPKPAAQDKQPEPVSS